MSVSLVKSSISFLYLKLLFTLTLYSLLHWGVTVEYCMFLSIYSSLHASKFVKASKSHWKRDLKAKLCLTESSPSTSILTNLPSILSLTSHPLQPSVNSTTKLCESLTSLESLNRHLDVNEPQKLDIPATNVTSCMTLLELWIFSLLDLIFQQE